MIHLGFYLGGGGLRCTKHSRHRRGVHQKAGQLDPTGWVGSPSWANLIVSEYRTNANYHFSYRFSTWFLRPALYTTRDTFGYPGREPTSTSPRR